MRHSPKHTTAHHTPLLTTHTSAHQHTPVHTTHTAAHRQTWLDWLALSWRAPRQNTSFLHMEPVCLVAIMAGTQCQEGFNHLLPTLRKAEECCRGAELHSGSHQWGGLQPGMGSTWQRCQSFGAKAMEWILNFFRSPAPLSCLGLNNC